MAPELLREDYDKTADIYSLGMMLLELATGLHLPSKGEEWEIIRFGDLSNQEEALSKLSPALGQLIMGLLAQDPLDRPTVEDIMDSPEFLKIQDIQQDENEKSSLFDYVREREKIASETAKAREHNNTYSTPEPRNTGSLRAESDVPDRFNRDAPKTGTGARRRRQQQPTERRVRPRLQ
ncbi:hypothetical protein G6F56_000064 [Rhizopus delemar]|nr:hypothetical protein G6F56_000064 [Rhizopus delemar]